MKLEIKSKDPCTIYSSQWMRDDLGGPLFQVFSTVYGFMPPTLHHGQEIKIDEETWYVTKLEVFIFDRRRGYCYYLAKEKPTEKDWLTIFEG